MKKIIIILCLICSLEGVYAQKIDGDSLLNSILQKIENKGSYELVGCLINEEFPGESKPFVKKVCIDYKDFSVFIFSSRFILPVIKGITAESFIIYDRINDNIKIFTLESSQISDSIDTSIIDQDFIEIVLLKSSNPMIDSILVNQEEKDFWHLYGMTYQDYWHF